MNALLYRNPKGIYGTIVGSAGTVTRNKAIRCKYKQFSVLFHWLVYKTFSDNLQIEVFFFFFFFTHTSTSGMCLCVNYLLLCNRNKHLIRSSSACSSLLKQRQHAACYSSAGCRCIFESCCCFSMCLFIAGNLTIISYDLQVTYTPASAKNILSFFDLVCSLKLWKAIAILVLVKLAIVCM